MPRARPSPPFRFIQPRMLVGDAPDTDEVLSGLSWPQPQPHPRQKPSPRISAATPTARKEHLGCSLERFHGNTAYVYYAHTPDGCRSASLTERTHPRNLLPDKLNMPVPLPSPPPTSLTMGWLLNMRMFARPHGCVTVPSGCTVIHVPLLQFTGLWAVRNPGLFERCC